MALSIATNTGALLAAASATSVNKDMESSMERLSTGKRINSASDDAAGVAIASRLSSEIRGTNQAIRNAQDGQAMLNTAEGAHKEVENILQRMRELAVQAANDTNDVGDRTNLAAEMTQLTTEIDRIASVTSWAGQNLLNGATPNSPALVHTDKASFSFHVGAGTSAGDTITAGIGAITSKALGIGGVAQNPTVVSTMTSSGTPATVGAPVSGKTTVTGDFNNGDTFSMKVNGIAFSVIADNDDQFEDNAKGIGAQLSAKIELAVDGANSRAVASLTAADMSLRGLTVTDNGDGGFTIGQRAAADTPMSITKVGAGAGIAAVSNGVITVTSQAATDQWNIDIDGISLSVVSNATDAYAETADGMAAQIANVINSEARLTGAGYSATVAGGAVTLVRKPVQLTDQASVSSGGAATLTESAGGVFSVGGSIDNNDVFNLKIDGEDVSVTIDTTDGYADDVKGAASQVAQAIKDKGISGLTVTDNKDGTFKLERFGSVAVTDAATAKNAISAIDTAIKTINSQRANLGAASNRMDNTVSNLTNVVVNLEGGRGRIEDADFAAESTSLAKSQILQQASTAMLAQANASKQNVLSLLQG
jgi:flagellin